MSGALVLFGLQPVGIGLLSFIVLLAVSTSGCGDGDDDEPATVRGAGVSSPTLEGPVTGGAGAPFVTTAAFDLAEVEYSLAEYFISGTATAYSSAEELTVDGHWTVTPGETADYKTRILVYRPIDPARFNGTVIVEWLNVSRGLDFAPVWVMAHTEFIRGGYAWVGVSAQFVGVEGARFIVGPPPDPLKAVDPDRYGSLVHPGDSFSFDIFSQAAQAIRRPLSVSPLGDLRADEIIAVGESQSAFRLVTYVNAVHPVADIYDGFLVHSRGGMGVPLSQTPLRVILPPSGLRIRTDLTDPVLTFVTENDLTLFGYLSARQEDSEYFRLWEVAGTAHADTYTMIVGMTDKGDSPAAAELVVTSDPVPGLTCGSPINSGPHHFVLKAAIAALNRWVRDGTPPSSAPRIEADPGPPAAILRDTNGNARGGVRTPQIDVPIAQLSGEGQAGSIFCILFGSTVPFDDGKLASLYPTHDAYVSAFNAVTDQAVAAGYILPPDGELMKAAAAEADIGG